jgi:drug/metabolite transporter (DMT)-like permease
MSAIPMWSMLPVLTVLSGKIPPLQLVAMTFTAGTAVGLAWLAASAEARRELRNLTWLAALVGVAGLFGFHLAYFLALQNAPPVEASLINASWPVLIVLFSTLLPRSAGTGRLSVWHVVGAAVAFAGAGLAVAGGSAIDFSGNAFGYGMALVSALTWSTFSVVTRLFHRVPSSAVCIYCAGTAALAWIAHSALEPTVWPQTATQTVAILASGLFPVGVAFYVWDYGCKHGDLRLLGVTAYFIPLFATTLMIATGLAEPRASLWVAAILVVGGALLASRGPQKRI